MSSNMYWMPKPTDRKQVDTNLKRAIANWKNTPCELNTEDLDYLKGLKAGGIKDVQPIISAIETHGAVLIEEEW